MDIFLVGFDFIDSKYTMNDKLVSFDSKLESREWQAIFPETLNLSSESLKQRQREGGSKEYPLLCRIVSPQSRILYTPGEVELLVQECRLVFSLAGSLVAQDGIRKLIDACQMARSSVYGLRLEGH